MGEVLLGASLSHMRSCLKIRTLNFCFPPPTLCDFLRTRSLPLVIWNNTSHSTSISVFIVLVTGCAFLMGNFVAPITVPPVSSLGLDGQIPSYSFVIFPFLLSVGFCWLSIHLLEI